MASIRELKQRKKELEGIKGEEQNILDIEKQIEVQTKKNAVNAKKRALAEKERLAFKKSILTAEKESRGISQDMAKLLDTQKGKLLERLGVLNKSNQLDLKRIKNEAIASLRAKQGNEQQQKARLNAVKGLNAVGDIQKEILSDFESGTLESLEIEDIKAKVLEKAGLSQKQFDKMSEDGKKAINQQINKMKAGIETLTQDGLEEMVSTIGDIEDEFGGLIKKAEIYGGILKSSELRGTALKAGIAAAAFSFAKGLVDNAIELRQELGLSVGESARLGAQVSGAELTLRAMGGNAGEVKNFATAISQEFGTINELSTATLNKFAALSATTGLTGESAAKLAKSIQVIQGGSLDASLNTIEVAGNLADAVGVSKKLVLEDIANDAENFAQFAKDGGRNIATAAVAARRLGLSLGNVADIASNLLDFESSIESQMEASVLLGRQLNLDKARELALTGDLAGLAEEVKNQVGSQADFEAMNVIERQSLAKAIGVSVADLGKMVAGEKTSAELAEKKAKELEEQQKTQLDLTKAMAQAQIISAGIATITGTINTLKAIGLTLSKKEKMEEYKGASALIAKAAARAGLSAASVPVIGAVLAIAAIAAVGAAGYKMLSKKPPAMETGGVVTKSGIAEVHKGEAVSGTKNQMGFGADMKETNNLLQKVIDESKQLRAENKTLMNTLTNRVGEMAMSS